VCHAVVLSSGVQNPAAIHALTISDDPVPLGGPERVSLSARHHYRIIETDDPRGPWRLASVGYLYMLIARDGREVIAFHWHPNGRSPVTFPHIHLGPAAMVGHVKLAAAHVPTGRVALADVLHLAISELTVEPQRADWETVLDEAKAADEAVRTRW
jgi:hypothetical protein